MSEFERKPHRIKRGITETINIRYVSKNISDPENEILEIELISKNIRIKFKRAEFRDFEDIYYRFALEEAEYFMSKIERPNVIKIKVTKDELETIKRNTSLDEEERREFWTNMNLLLVDIEIMRKDPKSPYYRVN